MMSHSNGDTWPMEFYPLSIPQCSRWEGTERRVTPNPPKAIFLLFVCKKRPHGTENRASPRLEYIPDKFKPLAWLSSAQTLSPHRISLLFQIPQPISDSHSDVFCNSCWMPQAMPTNKIQPADIKSPYLGVHGSFLAMQMLCSTMQAIMTCLMFLSLHSVFLYRTLHRPLSMPYTCSDTTHAEHSLLLKYTFLASLMFWM